DLLARRHGPDEDTVVLRASDGESVVGSEGATGDRAARPDELAQLGWPRVGGVGSAPELNPAVGGHIRQDGLAVRREKGHGREVAGTRGVLQHALDLAILQGNQAQLLALIEEDALTV